MLDLSSDPAPYHPILPPQLAAEDAAGGASAPSRPSAPRRPVESGAGIHETITAPSLPAREFRMPPVPAAHPVTQTLVQMDLAPTMDLHPQLRVPTIVLLASTPHRMAPKPFVAPPHRKTTMEVPGKVALEMRPPVLDVRAGYAKTPDVLSAVTPRLAAPVGAVAPVASNQEPVEPKPTAATVTGNATAEPSNIISLPDRPIPAASAIVLPPLNQVSGRDTASGTAGPMDPSGGAATGSKAGPGESAGTSNLADAPKTGAAARRHLTAGREEPQRAMPWVIHRPAICPRRGRGPITPASRRAVYREVEQRLGLEPSRGRGQRGRAARLPEWRGRRG